MADAPDAPHTLDAVLDAVRVVLEARGAKGTSIRRVADAAGVSIGTVQYYFPTRAALIEGFLTHRARWLESSITEHASKLALGAPLPEVVDQAARMVFRIAREHRALVRLRMLTILEDGEQSPAAHPLFLLDQLERIVALLGAPDAATVARHRLGAQTVIFAAARYALVSDEEMIRLTGARDVAGALDAIEAHIAELARAVVTNRG